MHLDGLMENCYFSSAEFRMCGSKNYLWLREVNMSSYPALSRRWLPILMAVCVLCAFTFAQEGSGVKAKQPKPGKKAASSGETQEKTKEGAKTAPTEKSVEGDQEEAKGPWHGLTWRLIGPYRGGRALAVSGVVGDLHTYYFGSTGGGVWK